jgi:hypothetical protein
VAPSGCVMTEELIFPAAIGFFGGKSLQLASSVLY